MFSDEMLALATEFLQDMRTAQKRIATAESCTGGLIAGLLTEIAGSSDVVERGFVTYSNEAKLELLNVPPAMLAQFGAVSEQVALAMAAGALLASQANIAVAVTGIAGPGGGSAEKPVGLVHLAAATAARTLHVEKRFGALGRGEIRIQTVREALNLARQLIAD
ncbi:MAG: CinA family protein [Caulobacterales bacterium]